MRQIIAAIEEYYDRLIVIVVVLVLFASLLHLTVRKVDLDEKSRTFKEQVEKLRPKHPVMDPITSEVYDSLLAQVKEPFQIPAWSNALFAPEKRIRCFECMKPVPVDAQKCPFCGNDKIGWREPVVPPDADKDGMDDEWERRFGLNPKDPSDAESDPDQDGFSNLEEFVGQTNPNAPESHPEYIRKVRVVRAYQVPFNLKFRSHMQSSGSNQIFQVNTVDNGRTYIVRMGEKVGEKGGDFVVESFEFKEQMVTNKTSGGIGGARPVDVSVLTLRRGEKQIPLILNQRVDWDEVRAVLSFPPDGTNWLVKAKDSIEVRSVKYVVMDIDSRASTVVLRRPDSGTTFTVGANGVVGVSEAIRSEPAGKASEAQEGE